MFKNFITKFAERSFFKIFFDNMQFLIPTIMAYLGGVYSGLSPQLVNNLGLDGWIICFFLVIFVSVGTVHILLLIKLRYEEMKALKNWGKNRDKINPLESEFTKMIISIEDLAHPHTRIIKNKKFHNCILIGPSNLIMVDSQFFKCVFEHCYGIQIEDHNGDIYINNKNHIVIQGCELINCEIWDCHLFVPNHHMPSYKNLIRFVS